MSLKDFVAQPEINEKLKDVFRTPRYNAKPPLLAPPLTKNYGLVGTAFDYLLRFHIQRLNPTAKTGKWVAELAASGEVAIGNKFFSLEEIVTKAKHNHAEYLVSGEITEAFLRATLELAQLDALWRRKELLFDVSYFESLGQIDSLDVQDLKQLISLVGPELFRAATTCLLNPTFGEASKLVGGADCDLVIDDTLLDIKTTKNFGIQRDLLNQLLGYYLLSKIGQVEGSPSGHCIQKLGIYFARFGYLWLVNVSALANERTISETANWFEHQARAQRGD